MPALYFTGATFSFFSSALLLTFMCIAIAAADHSATLLIDRYKYYFWMNCSDKEIDLSYIIRECNRHNVNIRGTATSMAPATVRTAEVENLFTGWEPNENIWMFTTGEDDLNGTISFKWNADYVAHILSVKFGLIKYSLTDRKITDATCLGKNYCNFNPDKLKGKSMECNNKSLEELVISDSTTDPNHSWLLASLSTNCSGDPKIKCYACEAIDSIKPPPGPPTNPSTKPAPGPGPAPPTAPPISLSAPSVNYNTLLSLFLLIAAVLSPSL